MAVPRKGVETVEGAEKTKFSFDGKCPYCGSDDVTGPIMGHLISNNPEVKLTNYQFKCNNDKCGRSFRRNLP